MFLNHQSIRSSGMSASRLKEFYCILHLFHASPYLSSLIWLITQVIFGHQHKIHCFLLHTFLHSPIASFLLILHKILQSCSLSTYNSSIFTPSTFTTVTVSHNLQTQFLSNTLNFFSLQFLAFVCCRDQFTYVICINFQIL